MNLLQCNNRIRQHYKKKTNNVHVTCYEKAVNKKKKTKVYYGPQVAEFVINALIVNRKCDFELNVKRNT